MIKILSTFLKILTILIILFTIIYRFRIKIPRDIFVNSDIHYFFIYIFIFALNCILFFIILLAYLNINLNVKTTSYFYVFTNSIKFWVDKSYEKVMDIIADMPGKISIIFAYITHYYLKIPLTIIKFITYAPRILLLIAFFFDVFYLQKFQISYYLLYSLLFTVISKAVWYISIEIDKRCLAEVCISITMLKPEETTRNIYTNPKYKINVNDFVFTENNRQFNTVKEALEMQVFVSNEIEQLEKLKPFLETSLVFQMLIRFFYIIFLGYIIYYYPLSF